MAMEYEITIGKKEYIVAGRLMSATAAGKTFRRVLFTTLASVCVGTGVRFLLDDNVQPLMTSLLFGGAATFIGLLLRTKSKWENRKIEERAQCIRPVTVTYGFYEDCFMSSAAGKKVRFSWNDLKNWGDFEAYLYLEFSGKQIVVIDRTQVDPESIKKIETLLHGWKQRNDFE